uniref:Dyp-type peroxidase n=1 Tax=Macrostomum lignano TaxID=282301 RepID=A0A1I8HSY2_9PLAT
MLNRCRLVAATAARLGCRRGLSSGGAPPPPRPSRLLLAAAVGTAAAAATVAFVDQRRRLAALPGGALTAVTAAAASDNVQPTVYSETKDHALYLTIHLDPRADKREVLRVAANLQKLVDKVCPPDLRDESDETWAGVGFGYSFYRAAVGQSGSAASVDFSYPHRRGALGELPSTGGDLFIHAKSNQVSKLFELCQAVTAAMPKGSVRSFEDIYSFVYRNGRDLSGFIDGTENAADEESRKQIAVARGGGSFVITQRWIHDLAKIRDSKPAELESFVGRDITDSTELRRKSISSHVARMTGGNAFEQKKQFEIVRQSMPYGTVSGESGLFFIAYAASPDNFNFMLDRMVGKGSDSHSDDIMRITRCVAGNYWYFPPTSELAKFA